MSYTITELFTRACSLVDSLKDDGTVDVNTTSDYKGRTLTLVDIAQKDLGIVADLFKIYPIARSPIDNMFGVGANWDVQEYKTDEDKILEVANNQYGEVKAYYFESDSSNGTAYIEDYNGSWNILDTISLTNTGIGFNAYSGTVVGTSGASKSRVRFSGNNFYRMVNVALFNYHFDTVPIYRPWVPYQLPADCKSIKDVIKEYPVGQYVNDNFFKIEWNNNRQTIYIDYYFSGSIKIQYKPYTNIPTSLTDIIELDDSTAIAISYFLAMNFVATEQNEFLTNFFNKQYDRLKSQVSIKQPISETSIVDFYGGI